MGQLIPIFTLILWLAFIDYSIQVDNGPELNLVTPTVTLLANSTFEVECSGYYPLEWIYPADWRSQISSRAQVNESYHSNRIKPYVSSLTIEELEYRFTGRYICASTIGRRPDEENFEDDSYASIYLYVYDENHLFAPLTNKSHLFATFPVFASNTLIIPCRPTRPEIMVQLTGDPEELIQSAVFDPRRGFIFEHPTDALEGMFHCSAYYEDMNETHMIILRFFSESTISPMPRIDDSAAKYPAVGKPFTLNCLVLKDLNTVINVEWTYPEGNDDIEISNTTAHDHVLLPEHKVHRLSTKLEVSKATENHTGNYNCIARTPKQTYNKSVYLEVHDQSPEPYVNLSSSLVSPVYVNESTEIKMVVNYELQVAELENKELLTEWTKDGLLMEPSLRIVMGKTSKQVILKIESAEVDDTGNYTLYVRMGDETGPTVNWTVAVFVKSF